MRTRSYLVASTVAGIFSLSTVSLAFPAADNTAKPPAFDHKTLGSQAKDCIKCHKTVSGKKGAAPAPTPAGPAK